MGSHRLHRYLPDPGRTLDETKKKVAKESSMERPPALEASLVQEFVIQAHADLDRVKELLGQTPALVNATWDWGGGDFETALGGASHMGRKDIANYLLEHGARIDLFAAAMLGKLDIIQAVLDAYPVAVNTPGPHGIPLIRHAELGGEEAKKVLEFLKEVN